MEALVRQGIKYDEAKHRTVHKFDELVTAETERRLKATEIEGSNVVAGVVSLFKQNGVPNPGAVPTDDGDMECPGSVPAGNKEGDMPSRRMRSGSGTSSAAGPSS